MMKKVATVFFWLCLASTWVDICLAFVFGAIPATSGWASDYMVCAGLFAVGAVYNYLVIKRSR